MTNLEKALKAGADFANAGEYQKAVNVYSAALIDSPNHHELLYSQAKAYFKLKDFEMALTNFDLLLLNFPGQADLISERAVVYHHMGDNDRALKELDIAAELEPENPFRYSSRAWIKAALKDVEGAIADYEKAIELDPEDAISYNNKGMLEDQLGYKKAAIKSFEKSNELAGYKPEFKNDQPLTSTEKTESEEPPGEDISEKPAKLTASDYGKTLKGIFTNKSERKEFFSFLKKMGK